MNKPTPRSAMRRELQSHDRRFAWGAAVALALTIGGVPPRADVARAEVAPVSSWSTGYNSRVRLIAGAMKGPGAAQGAPILAGVEMEFPATWKTYWRNPGDAGVPPSFDWSKSDNVAAATVLYPTPTAFHDKTGLTIGYTDGVVFPVMVTPRDPSRPAALRLAIEYGVCKDICVPAQAEVALDIAPGISAPVPPTLAAAFERVPRRRGQERAGDPIITSAISDLKSANPRLVLDVDVPGGAATAVAFLVTSEGGFMPIAVREPGAAGNKARFVVDLSKDVDMKDLKGKTVLVTVAGPKGASEAEIRIE